MTEILEFLFGFVLICIALKFAWRFSKLLPVSVDLNFELFWIRFSFIADFGSNLNALNVKLMNKMS